MSSAIITPAPLRELPIGTVATLSNDLVPEDERRNPPLNVFVFTHTDHGAEIGICVDGWAESAEMDVDEATRLRDLLTQAITAAAGVVGGVA